MTTDEQARELQRTINAIKADSLDVSSAQRKEIAQLSTQVAEADAARRYAQAVSSELVQEKRGLKAALQSLLNAIDDSHDDNLPAEIVAARDAAYRAIAVKRGASQDHIPDASNKGASETVLSVTEWANTTFGQATIRTQIARAEKEFVELLKLQEVDHDNAQLAEEAADVCICLYRVIGTLDPEAINKKMKKNRARKWQVDGNGTAQHVGE